MEPKLIGDALEAEVSALPSTLGERRDWFGCAAAVRNDYQPVRDIFWL